MKPLTRTLPPLLALSVMLLASLLVTHSTHAAGQSISLGEALDNTDLTWTTGGDADWFGQSSVFFSGGDAAQSGAGHESWIETTVTGPGILSFNCSTTSIFLFYVDEQHNSSCSLSDEWAPKALAIAAGEHTVRWSALGSSDVSYLDNVIFSQSHPVSLSEALDNASLTWTTGGDTDWSGVMSDYFNGDDVAQSSGIDYGQVSWLQTAVSGPGILSFDCQHLSGYSWALTVLVDGENPGSCQISSGWKHMALAIPSGEHTVRWDYEPNSPSDAVFVDNVVFEPAPAILLQTPSPGNIWHHRHFYNITWVDSGIEGSVRIELSQEGVLRHTIAASTENDGSYRWFVPSPLPPAENYRVTVASIVDSTIQAQTAGTFSIAASALDTFSGVLIPSAAGGLGSATTSDHIELDIGDELAESFTIEAWFNMHTSGSQSTHQGIFRKREVSNSTWLEYYDWVFRQTVACIGINDWSEENFFRQVCGAYYLNTWHHAALTFDSTNQQAQNLSERRILWRTQFHRCYGSEHRHGRNRWCRTTWSAGRAAHLRCGSLHG